MSEDLMVICANSDCRRTYNKAKLERCPACQSGKSEVSAFVENELKARKVPYAPNPGIAQSEKIRYGHKAADSAKVVDLYGTFIQTAGVVIGILTCALYSFNAIPTSDNAIVRTLIGFIVGGLIGLGAFAIGAVYRMLANYIIFKTK